MRKISINSFTFAAVCSAVIVVVFYISTLIDTMKLAAGIISTLAMMMIISKSGIKYAWIAYVSISTLLFLIAINKFVVLMFAIFFGLYAIIKFYIEKLNNIICEWLLKTVFFNAVLSLCVFIMHLFELKLGISLPIFWVAALTGMVCYDIILSYGILYLSRVFKQFLK